MDKQPYFWRPGCVRGPLGPGWYLSESSLCITKGHLYLTLTTTAPNLLKKTSPPSPLVFQDTDPAIKGTAAAKPKVHPLWSFRPSLYHLKVSLSPAPFKGEKTAWNQLKGHGRRGGLGATIPFSTTLEVCVCECIVSAYVRACVWWGSVRWAKLPSPTYLRPLSLLNKTLMGSSQKVAGSTNQNWLPPLRKNPEACLQEAGASPPRWNQGETTQMIYNEREREKREKERRKE